jgi:hypothetical protein
VNTVLTAESFSHHFEQKVSAVQASTTNAAVPDNTSRANAENTFSHFQSFSPDDLLAAVRSLPDKSSNPLPVNLLKQVAGELAPYFTEL